MFHRSPSYTGLVGEKYGKHRWEVYRTYHEYNRNRTDVRENSDIRKRAISSKDEHRTPTKIVKV